MGSPGLGRVLPLELPLPLPQGLDDLLDYLGGPAARVADEPPVAEVSGLEAFLQLLLVLQERVDVHPTGLNRRPRRFRLKGFY